MTKILISTCIFFNTDYSNKLLKTFPYLVDSLHILRGLYDVDMIVYYDSTVPEHIIEYYKDKGVILKKEPDGNFYTCTFWRFNSYNLKGYDIYIFRDIDIRLEENDLIIMDTFIKSDRHVYYSFARNLRNKYPRVGYVLAGFFGIKNTVIFDFENEIENFKLNNNLEKYGADEKFLSKTLYLRYQPIIFCERKLYDSCVSKFKTNKLNLPDDYEIYVLLDKFKFFI